MSGPMGDTGWVAVVPGLFPPVLSSLVLGPCAPGAGTDPLCVMQPPLQQQRSRGALNNYLMGQCCRRERQDQGISLNLVPLDKAALRESRTCYVPDAPHEKLVGIRGL